jgi:hypothetical protein
MPRVSSPRINVDCPRETVRFECLKNLRAWRSATTFEMFPQARTIMHLLQTILRNRSFTGTLLLALIFGLVSAGAGVLTVALLQSLLPDSAWGPATGESLETLSLPARYLAVSIIAPLLETLPGQLLPIEISRAAKAGMPWQIALSAVWWSWLHVLGGAGAAQAIIMLEVGAVLAVAYIVARTISVWRAYVMAALVHAIHNTLMITLF